MLQGGRFRIDRDGCDSRGRCGWQPVWHYFEWYESFLVVGFKSVSKWYVGRCVSIDGQRCIFLQKLEGTANQPAEIWAPTAMLGMKNHAWQRGAFSKIKFQLNQTGHSQSPTKQSKNFIRKARAYFHAHEGIGMPESAALQRIKIVAETDTCSSTHSSLILGIGCSNRNFYFSTFNFKFFA